MAPRRESRPQLRRKDQAAATRRRLLDSAEALFTAHGFDAVSVGDIASEAAVAHGLVFHYFGTKRNLYLEVMRRAADGLVQAYSFDEAAEPVDQIRGGLTAFLTYLSEHRGLARQIILSGQGPDSQAWEVFETARWKTVEAAAIRFGVDPNRPAVRMAGRAASAAIDQAAAFWLDNGQPFSIDQLVDWMLRATFHILREAIDLEPLLDNDDALRQALTPPSGLS